MSESDTISVVAGTHPSAIKALSFFDNLFPEGVETQPESQAKVAREALKHSAGDDFLDQIRRFDGFGAKTASLEEQGVPYLINEFWTSGQRRAHSIHEVSYRACFKPQLPEFFIARLTKPNEGVHDPFMGRGTTPIQAALMGRRPLANDTVHTCSGRSADSSRAGRITYLGERSIGPDPDSPPRAARRVDHRVRSRIPRYPSRAWSLNRERARGRAGTAR